jgi:hypothetical protein
MFVQHRLDDLISRGETGKAILGPGETGKKAILGPGD